FVGLIVVLASARALGQSGPELLFKPWPTGQRFEGQADGVFLADGETKNADQFQLNYYSASGRVRLWPEQRADPRFGFDITYITTNTNDPALPSHMSDESFAFSTGVADINGWRAGITLGLGYAAVGCFDDGNALYGRADLIIGHDIDDTS